MTFKKGERPHNFKGFKYVVDGRKVIYMPDHPRVKQRTGRDIFEYILIAEKVLGKYLPKESIIHHIDGDPTNNSNNNLVICENTAYHSLIHQKQRAIEVCGHANWRSCNICHRYDNTKNLFISEVNNKACHHRECWNKYHRELRRKSLKIKRRKLKINRRRAS